MASHPHAYIDIYIGDEQEHRRAGAAYDATVALLLKNAAIYGLPSAPSDLSEEQQQILKELDVHISLSQLRFAPPSPLLAGRLVFELDSSQGLSKTTANFLALCTGEKGACKNAPNKKLHYLGSPIHRIVKDFVAQGGDVTRGDGSGGESIYGGKFNDDKAGLKKKMRRGSLAMANSGKNTNSSQFFVVLTDDENKLAKMNGKYVIFGELKEGWEVLEQLNEVGGGADGKPTLPVWIGGCGKLTD
ncbi:cyclophilin-like domain-containing protein [Trametes maxima]|nr:cyclophilin-like domain-containing protein [Trametes maxima]